MSTALPAPPATCPSGTWTLLRPGSPRATDCADHIADAYPGQTAYSHNGYSATGIPGPNFDYNCDGYHDDLYENLTTGDLCCNYFMGQCSVLFGTGCDIPGWQASTVPLVPMCGEGRSYLDCGMVEVGGLLTCRMYASTRYQPCR